MKPILDLTDSLIMTALRSFLLAVLPDGVEVVKGQNNRVPEPASPDFVVMTPVRRTRLSTNTDTWDETDPAASVTTAQRATQVGVQLDIHGPNSTDNAQIIATLFRDSYACDFFAATGLALQPLYATDGQQMPFLNAEAQYEDRWLVEVQLQANPIVSTPQDFASSLAVQLVEIDATYPPGAA